MFCKKYKNLKSELQLELEQDPKYKRTLIFDLDETLIHCLQDNRVEGDVELDVKFNESQTIVVKINIRPYAKEILERLSKQYEIIVFTASFQCYADKILDYIDPEKEYIKHRLYREHCLQTQDGIYLKDLRIFKNRDLSNLILIDNSAYSYFLQPLNAIPIIPFYDNKQDNELKDLTQYLLNINLNQFRQKDIRDILARSFMLDLVQQYCSVDDAYMAVLKKTNEMGYGYSKGNQMISQRNDQLDQTDTLFDQNYQLKLNTQSNNQSQLINQSQLNTQSQLNNNQQSKLNSYLIGQMQSNSQEQLNVNNNYIDLSQYQKNNSEKKNKKMERQNQQVGYQKIRIGKNINIEQN